MADQLRQWSYKRNISVQSAIWSAAAAAGMISTVLVLMVPLPFPSSFFHLSLSINPTSFRISSWLSPPYIYILLNFIIITIAASSTFHHQKMQHSDINDHEDYDSPANHDHQHNNQTHFQYSAILATPPPSKTTNLSGHNHDVDGDDDSHSTTPRPQQNSTPSSSKDTNHSRQSPSDHVTEKSTAIVENSIHYLSQETCVDFGKINDHPEYQIASSRFNETVKSRRKTVRGEVGVPIKPEKEDDDTLEATWKAISERGGKPMSRQLKKSDTWNEPAAPAQVMAKEDMSTTWRELRKLETFNDAVSARRRGGLRRGHPSLSQDELNRRVEAFINKFNHEMRLQRQESDQRFLDMINRGI